MKVQIISREFIKPFTPTPPSLKNYKISLFDELAPKINIPLILYYPAVNGPNYERTTDISKCGQLKKSLAETLAKFYPLAGRYMKDSHSVDCSDQGAEFVQAQVDFRLTDLLSQGVNLKVEELNNFLPSPLGAADEITDPLLAVQINIFDCGGLAIGFCIAHRLADMSTTSTFIKEWAITASGEEAVDSISPIFNDSALFFPGGRGLSGFPLGFPRSKENIEVHKIVTKMIYFNKKAISSIRAKVSLQGSSKSQPTKVQSVFGIIWKALVDINVAKDGQPKDFIAVESINLRERTVPPLSKYSFGNLYMLTTAKSVARESEMEFQVFVDLLGESVKSAVNDCGKILSRGEDGQMMLINGFTDLIKACLNDKKVNSCIFSSWSNFRFYEADFGWGKPIWVSSVNLPIRNNVNLIDDKEGDGIEAWVNLDEKDMPEFQQHPNIRGLNTYVGGEQELISKSKLHAKQ